MVKENNRGDGDVKLFPKIIGIASLLKNEPSTSHRSENWPSPRSITFCANKFVLQKGESVQVAMLDQVEHQFKNLDRLRLDRTQDAPVEVEGFGLVEKIQLREVIAGH